MKGTKQQPLPRARREGLVVKVLRDEVLVYDLERHEAHCLNTSAALVWKHCDGTTTASESAALLRKELKSPADEEVVRLALDGLRKANLLRDTSHRKTEPTRPVSRRALIRKLGLAAGLLPLVASIVVPEAAAAQSINCSAFTTQQSCENPLKACGAAGSQLFCRWRNVGGVNQCICTSG